VVTAAAAIPASIVTPVAVGIDIAELSEPCGATVELSATLLFEVAVEGAVPTSRVDEVTPTPRGASVRAPGGSDLAQDTHVHVTNDKKLRIPKALRQRPVTLIELTVDIGDPNVSLPLLTRMFVPLSKLHGPSGPRPSGAPHGDSSLCGHQYSTGVA